MTGLSIATLGMIPGQAPEAEVIFEEVVQISATLATVEISATVEGVTEISGVMELVP